MAQSGQHKIVILEADQLRRNYLKSIISAWGYIPYCFEKETICLDNLSVLAPDLAVYGATALEKTYRFVTSLRLIGRKLPLLILSNNHAIQDYIHTNGFASVLMLKENANPSEIRRIISDNINNRTGNEMISDGPLIIGNSPEIIKIKKMIPELGRSRETIFIRGEAGTGKELIAKIIYLGSDRRNNPFVKVNAAAIPPAAAAKEIFCIGPEPVPVGDHFSGSLLAGVNAATVFLDRIESLPADLQVSLLRIFEEGGADSLDTVTEKSNDVRIIAAADTDLEPLVDRGVFRKDLYYRLNVLKVAIPPLRNRKEDISLLADFFADKFCLKFGRGCFEISSKVKTILCSYHWPGNVAELEHMIRDMVVSGDENKIIETLGGYYKNNKRRGIADFFEDFIHPDISDLKKYENDFSKVSMKGICRINKIRTEGELMKKALEFTNWNRKKTAKML
ncbi:MAG: sigma 54-interacting transcriptional regulator, partial [bacterium]